MAFGLPLYKNNFFLAGYYYLENQFSFLLYIHFILIFLISRNQESAQAKSCYPVHLISQ